MQIEVKRGLAGNITTVETPKGAVECALDNTKVLFNRDLADKVNEGDEILVAGKSKDGNLFQALAVNNKSQNKTAQIDATNISLALGLSGFITIICGVQAINYANWGYPTTAFGLALGALTGFFGIIITTMRIFEISKASRQVKYTLS